MRTRKQVRSFGEDITNLQASQTLIQNRRKRKGRVDPQFQQPNETIFPKDPAQSIFDEHQLKDYYNDIICYGHKYFQQILSQQTYIPKISLNSTSQNIAQNITNKQQSINPSTTATTTPKVTLFASSPQLTQHMRDILIGWLVQVNHKMSLRQETLYLTIYLVDRYCSYRRVDKSSYQLLAMACLFVAGKYEEVATPKLKKIMNLCDRLYQPCDVLKMQSDVLIQLKFKISQPSLHWFTNLQLTTIQQTSPLCPPHTIHKFKRKCHYLTQLCLFQIYLLTRYPPQVLTCTLIQVLSRQTQFINIDTKPCIQYLNTKQIKLVRECTPYIRKVYGSRFQGKYQAVNCRYQDMDEGVRQEGEEGEE